jgi:hypothetical protein
VRRWILSRSPRPLDILRKHSVHMRSGKVLIRLELGKGPQNYGYLKVVVRAEALECSRG